MTPRKQGTAAFVKAADTRTDPSKSRSDIETMLRRYGAVGFNFAVDLEKDTVTVSFMLPDSPKPNAPRVPVTLPVEIRRVYHALYGTPRKGQNYDTTKMRKAERVAWRNLVLWIDAALSAASIGVQTITEAFLAHTVVVRDDGRQQRMMDYLNDTGGALPSGARALLPAVVAD